jgi:hypothetical protein
VAALIGACAALGLAGLALADTITGDANSVTTNIDPSVTVSQGSSGSGKFGLVVNDNAADPVNGCNAGTGGSKPPVVLSVASNQPWLTLGQSTITLTGCDNGTTADGLQNAANVSFSVANNAPAGATATVTAIYQSGGASGGTYTSGSFQVKTPAAPPNTAPSKPGKPSASSSLNNDGVFGLNWAASTDAEGNPISYRLEHKDANDAGYSLVTGAGSLSGSSFAFTSSASEGEGTWTYQVRASDGTLSSPFSDPSDPVKVDKSGPNAPSISASKTPEYDPSGTDNDWFKDSVTLVFSANGDPTLQDGSAGSGVDPNSIPADVTKNTSGSHLVSGTIKDNAGNQSSASRTVNVDATDPTVDIAGCPSGVVGRDSSHAIDVSASDAQSGLASNPSGSVALDTSAAGQHTKTVTAVDNVGHEKSASCTYTVNSPPGAPGKPSASSSLNNDGVFRLDWTAASDPDNNVDHYALQHKDADDAGYSPVSGAGSLGASAFAFSASAPEGEGTWTYQAKAVDAFGEDGPYSAASDPVKVDKSAPSAPTASFDRAPEDATGNWFKDSVGQLRWQQRSEAGRRQRRERRRRLHGRPDVQHVRVPRLLGEGHRQGWERLRAGDRHGQGGRHRPGRDPDLPDESGRSWQQRLSELDGRGCPLRGRRGRQRLDLARHERGRPEDGLRAGWHRPRQRRTRVRRGELPVPGGL